MYKLSFKKTLIALTVIGFCHPATAHTNDDTVEYLDEVVVTATQVGDFQSMAFQQGRKASDVSIEGKKFQTRSPTLGNALAAELGVHSNPFGGGSSAPVIRGQEGVRIKLLQNGSDIVDMSHISPDHVVVADTLLAQQVELVRGTSTLMYGMASPAGVVNIVDRRIPTARLEEKNYEGEFISRFDTASKEQVFNAGVSFNLGKHFVARLEGLTRKADNYRVPEINLGQKLNYLPDSHHKSDVGTVGLSWVGEKGYLGISYNHRKDHYGIPGHNHEFDYCSGHLFDTTNLRYVTQVKSYLLAYPHLMEDEDIIDNLHFHCGTDLSDEKHSHDNVYGHKHNASTPGPVIDMRSKRYDLRGEWRKPVWGIDRIKLALSFADYYHDEKHDGKVHLSGNESEEYKKAILHTASLMSGKPEAFFYNKGFNSRLEIYHQPTEYFNGLIGLQYQTQKSKVARLPSNVTDDIYNLSGERYKNEQNPLVENTNKQLSVFALEQFKWRDFIFEAGVRWEKQHIPIRYDQSKYSVSNEDSAPDLSHYRDNALSYSGTLMWDFHPDYRLSITASHNERMPSPMELYYHGKHLATNSFEYGNKNLKKERSNNIELGIMHFSDKWDAKFSTYYQGFKNYIHNENLYRQGNLYMRRYNQSQAKFYGLEGEIGYQVTPNHKVTLFGDIIRGKLFGFSNFYGNKKYQADCFINEWDEEECDYTIIGQETIKRPDRNAARVPPIRLGFRIHSHFGENWSGSLEYTHVFTQKKTSVNTVIKAISREEEERRREDAQGLGYDGYYPELIPEDKTKGYNLLNLGVNYRRQIGGIEYNASLSVNNLLNEKIYIHNSYLPYVPQMGRNFVLNLGMNF